MTFGEQEEMETLLEFYWDLFVTWFEEMTPCDKASRAREVVLWIRVLSWDETCNPEG